MNRFMKAFNFNIITLTVSSLFLFTNTLYSSPVYGDNLRVPLGRDVYARELAIMREVAYGSLDAPIFPTHLTKLEPGINTYTYQPETSIIMILGVEGLARDSIILTRDESTKEYIITYQSKGILRFSSGKTITVGRNSDSSVVINPKANSVSRLHIEIEAKGDTIVINDTASLGTLVQSFTKKKDAVELTEELFRKDISNIERVGEWEPLKNDPHPTLDGLSGWGKIYFIDFESLSPGTVIYLENAEIGVYYVLEVGKGGKIKLWEAGNKNTPYIGSLDLLAATMARNDIMGGLVFVFPYFKWDLEIKLLGLEERSSGELTWVQSFPFARVRYSPREPIKKIFHRLLKVINRFL